MILVDTGAWLALIDQGDTYHLRSKQFFQFNRESLVTTTPVLVESVHLMYKRIGVTKTIAWMDTLVSHDVHVFEMRHNHIVRMTELMKQYSDLPMDVADASLVILAEELGEGRIVSTDQRDFHAYRWKNQYPFHNLLMTS
jgi:predicted nucleic acid-binding protein